MAKLSPMAAATQARERALAAALAARHTTPMAAAIQQREQGLTSGIAAAGGAQAIQQQTAQAIAAGPTSNWSDQTAVAGPEPTTQTPAPAAPTQPAVAPFLTPAQQLALSNYIAKTQGQITNYQGQLGSLVAKNNLDLSAAAHSRDVGNDNTNQALAARGLFQSSIRDADLNDIELTYNNKVNTLNTALNTATLKINSQIGTLNTDMTNEQNYYNTLKIQNANSITPPLNSPAPTQGGSPTPTQGTSQSPTAPQSPASAVLSGAHSVSQATQGSIAGYVPPKQTPMGASMQNRERSLAAGLRKQPQGGTSSWGGQTAVGVPK